MTREQFTKLLISEPLYLINEYEQAVIRSEIVEGTIIYYVKFKGEKEFKATRGSAVVVDVLMPSALISKQEYDNF